MDPIYFDSPAAFRRWLKTHHAKATEVLVGFWKKETGEPSLSWSESVDEALCFGWIDGVRRSVDSRRYTIRFTPRRPGSNWSAINVAKMARLEQEGRLHPAGRKAFEARTAQRTQVYSYEQRAEARLTAEQSKAFRANTKAWAWFQEQAASYRQSAVYWVSTAKQEATRERRFASLVRDSAKGLRVEPLRPRTAAWKKRG